MALARIDLSRMTPDLHDFDHRNGAREIVNLLPLDGKLRPVRKASAVATLAPVSGATEPVMGALYHPARGTMLFGTRGVAIPAATSHLYEADFSGSGSITHRSKAGNYSSDFDQWDCTLFDQWAIFTKIDDPVQYIDATASLFANLITSTSTPKAKYCCAAKTHLVLGWINESATDYPLRIWWSAQGDPQDFDVGSARSGYLELPSSGGDISGLVGFEEFFLVFTTRGVWRVDWIGGADVWNPTQIGSEPDGMPEVATQSAARLRANTAVYRANDGLRIISGGESPVPMTKGSVESYDRTASIVTSFGAFPTVVDAKTGLAIMVGNYTRSPGAETDPGGLVYNVDEDRFTLLRQKGSPADLGLDFFGWEKPMGLASVPWSATVDGDYLSNIAVVYWNPLTSDLELYILEDYGGANPGYASWYVESRLVEPSPGSSAKLSAVRALVHTNSSGSPTVSVLVESFSSMIINESSADDAVTLTSKVPGNDNEENSDGWLVGKLPMQSPRFRFKVSGTGGVPDGSNPLILRDFVGIDIVVDRFSQL